MYAKGLTFNKISRHARALLFSTVSIGAFFLGSSAQAVNVDPGDYLAPPSGTNLALLYLQHAASHSANITGSGAGTGDINHGTSLTTDVAIARFVHYTDIGGTLLAPQILLPTADIHHASLGGTRLNDASGVGDPILALPVWLVNNPSHNQYLGFSPYLFIPAGTYHSNQSLNVGENRWKGNFQGSYIQGLSSKWTAEFTADVTVYGDNSSAGNGHQTLSQQESYQLQPYLKYAVTDHTVLSVGYNQTFGGKQEVANQNNGFRTEEGQARLVAQYNVSPTFNVEALVARDLYVRGGFKEDGRLNLRFLQAF